MSTETYIPEDHIENDGILRAELASGTLTPWLDGNGQPRVDGNGRRWYKRDGEFPEIHAASDDIEEDIEADDDGGCEFYEVDAAGERVPLQGMEHVGRIRGIPKPKGQFAEEGEEGTPVTTADARRLKLYYGIVERRAAGEDIDAEMGDDILELAGKSMDDFDADVAELCRLNMELGSDDDDFDA